MLPLIFLFFGLTSPIITRLMPDLLSEMAGEFEITLPPQTWLDSFMQFFKNMNQIGLIGLVIVLMGSVSDEKNKGTLLMVLTKPVSKSSFVLAKVISASLLFLLSSLLAFFACALYTSVLFEGMILFRAIEALVPFIVFGLCMICVTVGISSMFRNNIASGGISLAVYFIFSLSPLLGAAFREYSPGALIEMQGGILAGIQPASSILEASFVTLIIGLAVLFVGIRFFEKQEI